MAGTVERSDDEEGKERTMVEGRDLSPATLVLQNRLSHHPVLQLSLGQVVAGLLALLSQLVVHLCNDVHLHLNTMGEGLWAGIVFITVGCLGVFTTNRVNQFNVRSFLVSNICAFFFSLLLLVLSCCLLVDIIWYQEEDGYAQSGFYVLKTFLALEIVVALVEIILSVTCGCLCYKSSFTSSGGVLQRRYPLTTVRVFSVIHIVIGVSSFVFFIILFTLSFDSRHSLTCEEVYCGLAFICIGVFGLYTVKHINMTSLLPFMILNIFGCIFAGILLSLAGVRVLMLDRVQENLVSMRQQDLLILPHLNCTKDVLEAVREEQNTPNIFGVVRDSPSQDQVRHNIEQCQMMKLQNIREAKEIVSGQSDVLGWPRNIYLIEIGLSLLELVTAVICVVLCCRACCSVRLEGGGAPHLTEQQKWQLVVQEYNEYRK